MLERMVARLSALREAEQLRDLRVCQGIPLNSNDYLGLSAHARLRQAIRRAVEEDTRVASTGSRLLSGHHERWENLETEFAAFIGAEAALYFGSGYTANIALISSVLKPEDTVYSDAANHASLIDGIRLSRARTVVFPHLDLNFLEDALLRHAGGGERLVVTESTFSMEGDRAPLRELLALCERFGAYLIVDEAHSIGVDGPAGRGSVVAQVGGSEHLLATVYTCGKALASMGAFVTGSRTLREFLLNHGRPFIFATALPPYCAAHVREGLTLAMQADAERAHLLELGEYLRGCMRRADFDTAGSASQIVPLILGSNDTALRFAGALSKAGFSVRAIRPPTVPSGSARLRFSLNAHHTTREIDALVDTLSEIREAEAVTE